MPATLSFLAALGADVYLYALLAVGVLALARSVLLRRKVDARNAELIRANTRLTEDLAISRDALESSEKRLVDQRTNELRRANQRMELEIKERRRAEAQTRTLSMAVEQSPVSVFITDPEGLITYANPKTLEVLGYERHALVGSDPRMLRSDRQPPEAYKDIWETILDGRDWSGEICNRTADGRDIWQSASISPIKDEAGRIVNFVAVMEDITDKKRRDDKMRHMALHDTLTGLPNRTLFMDRLIQALERVQRSNSRLAVMYIDLDNFKPVNDTLGHEAGDQVLREVAGRFQDCVRKVDTMARIGGDEFAAVLQDVQKMEDVDIAARRILACFDTPLDAAPGFGLSASIGISTCPKHGFNPNMLIQCADQAMYEAKQAGRNTFRYAE